MESTADTLEGRLGGSTSIKEREDTDPDTLQKGPKRRGTCCCSSRPPPTADYCLTRLMALALAAVALLPSPASSLIPEFLSYKTCVNQPPAFSGCMSNVTADFGERVVLNCQVDPRCMIQYLHWYHEDIYGEKRLLKTSKNSNDPYLHTIRSLEDTDLGRYVCIIANVMGKSECAAYLSVNDGAPGLTAATGMPTLLATCAASVALLWKWRTTLQTTHITMMMTTTTM